MRKTVFAIGLGLALTVPAAFASSAISPGGSVAVLPTASLPCGADGTGCAASKLNQVLVNPNNAAETATVSELVYLGATGYDFFYQFTNTTTSANPDTFNEVNMDMFGGYNVSVAVDNNCGTGQTCIAPSATTAGGAVASRDGGAGNGVNFFFQGPAGTDGTLGPQQSTYWLEVDTNAPSFQLGGFGSVIDSGTATDVPPPPLYEPSAAPEPASLALLGGGLALLGLSRLRKSKKA